MSVFKITLSKLCPDATNELLCGNKIITLSKLCSRPLSELLCGNKIITLNVKYTVNPDGYLVDENDDFVVDENGEAIPVL